MYVPDRTALNPTQNPPPCMSGQRISEPGSGVPVRARAATSSRFATGGMPMAALPLPPSADM